MVERVKYDATEGDWLVWRHPGDDLELGTVVIVHESQFAVFVRGGRVCDVLGPGSHALTTLNLPLLARWVNRPFDGKTPFPAEVWFVNRAGNGGIKWGTRSPVALVDPVHAVPVQVRAYGTWQAEVSDPALLLRSLVGTLPYCTVERIRDHFEAEVVAAFSETLANMLPQARIPLTEVPSRLEELSAGVAARLRPPFAAVGLRLAALTVQSVNLPESDLAKLRAGPSVEERLRRLKGLHEQGLISPDDYAARRRAMLDDA